MSASGRSVTPELLDELDPRDGQARRSRRDLRRIHRAMGSVSILRGILDRMRLVPSPRSIVELGGGDGTLLLRLAKVLKPHWTDVQLTILDKHDLVSERTRDAYRHLGWHLSVQQRDVLEWAKSPAEPPIDLCIAVLFLHHFNDGQLAELLRAVAFRATTFIACEPQRDILGRLGGACVGLIGANAVTRTDAVKSVAAGFRDAELMHLWPQPREMWSLHEVRAWPFTHCFTAARLPVPAGDDHAS